MAETQQQVNAEKRYDQYEEYYRNFSLSVENDWIDIFYGKIKFDFYNNDDKYKFKYAVYTKIEYIIRIVEVKKGKTKGGETWLSKVTKDTLGDDLAGYSNAIIKLDEETSKMLTKSAYVTEEILQDVGYKSPFDQYLFYDIDKRPPQSSAIFKKMFLYEYGWGPNRDIKNAAFPNLYIKPQGIPTQKKFDPDLIYPGERFVILIPCEKVFNPTIQIPNTFLAGVWIGLVFTGAGTYKFGGGYGKIMVIFQLSALWEKEVPLNIAGLLGGGGHVGVGIGGHVEFSLILFANAQQAKQLNGYNFGFDWDLVLASINKNSFSSQVDDVYSMLTKVFRKSGILNKLSKVTEIGTKNVKYFFNYKTLKKLAKEIVGLDQITFKTLVETLLKNNLSNPQGLVKSGEPISIQVPVPKASWGKHIFVGLRGGYTKLLFQYDFTHDKFEWSFDSIVNNTKFQDLFDNENFIVLNEIKYEVTV